MGGPLRVLHVVVNMNRGGAETLIMNLYRNIDRSKVQFDFLTCKDGVFDSEIKEMGGFVHRIPYISDVGHFRYKRELIFFFTRNNDYKVVHSHLDRMSGLVLHAAKQARIPIRISHSHNTRSEGGMAVRVYKWYAGKNIIPNATNLLACSKDAAKWLYNKEFVKTKIIKNGIEILKFSFSLETRNKVRNELQICNNTFVLGHVGRFNHQKNHSFLIDIFAKFNRKVENSILILVGDGPLRVEIENKIKNLKIGNKVILLGIRSDIYQLLQAFDVFVFPSLHEGLPVSLIEAQGAGLPCLISDTISQEVDMDLGLVDYSSINSSNEWVEKIKGLKTRQINQNRDLIHSFNEDYNIKQSAIDLEDFYLSKAGDV